MNWHFETWAESMDSIKDPKRLILFPLLLFAAFFVADKIFLLPSVQIKTQKDPTYLYYQYKYDLLDKLKTDFSNEAKQERQVNFEKSKLTGEVALPPKLLIVIGSSRLLFFDYQTFRRSFPEWEVYNFSVPVNAPAYYAYILERIYESGVRPDYLILESDPFQFNEYSPGFRQSNLKYSFDLRFILSHFSQFDSDDISAYLGRWLFAGMKFPPHPDRLLSLMQGKDRFLPMFVETKLYTENTNGCGFSPIPVPGWFEKDFSTLSISSAGTVGWLYSSYKVSTQQWKFFEQALEFPHNANTPVLILRPQVSRPMQHILDSDSTIVKHTQDWKNRLDQLITNEVFLDFSKGEPYYCNAYVDGSHMAVECYDPVIDEAMKYYQTAAKNKSSK